MTQTTEDTMAEGQVSRRDLIAQAAGASAALMLGACTPRSQAGEPAAAQAPAASAEDERERVAAAPRMPAVYLPHGGGPCFFMEWRMGPANTWDAMRGWLEQLPQLAPTPPKALLVVSAHWEEAVPTVLTSPQPPLLYDYSGFPAHTYELQWPAPGAPALGARVRTLLTRAGIASAESTQRGLDHGVFIPLKLGWPDAGVPTLQLSLQRGLDPAAHLALGRALAPLRDEGVLILGSGMSYHNMRRFGRPGTLPASEAFDAWLAETVGLAAVERDKRLVAWEAAPSARECHPREEHLLPLMVVAGAAGGDAGRVPYRDVVMGARVSAHVFG